MLDAEEGKVARGYWQRKAARLGARAVEMAAPMLVALAVATPLAGQGAATAEKPTATYWVYVGAESSDQLFRVRFGPDGAAVERTIPVGELPTEMEGPHGLAISRDGKWMYMTTGHGTPDGKWWKFALGADTLVGPSIFLGNFPATMDITPDGLYTVSANFNLHGDMVPSSLSVVYTPRNEEVARIVTCTMPHGSRIDPSGRFQYSGCMMDDQLVEVDLTNFAVSRRFSVAKGKEGPLPKDAGTMAMAGGEGHQMAGMDHGAMHDGAAKGSAPAAPRPVVDPAEVGYQGARHQMAPNTCSPTWAQPSVDGKKVFVACNKEDVILEVDRTSWTLTRTFTTGRGPYNLAPTPDGKLLLATLKQGAGFEVFDLATGKSVAQLKNSTTVANGLLATPDSRYAFVASEGVGAAPGKVDVYDLHALAKVATVDVGQQAGAVAFWKMEPAR